MDGDPGGPMLIVSVVLAASAPTRYRWSEQSGVAQDQSSQWRDPSLKGERADFFF